MNDVDAWDSLKHWKPALTPNVQFESRTERDQRWLLLRNSANGDHVRLNERAAQLINQFDGKSTIESICSSDELSDIEPNDIANWLEPLVACGIVTVDASTDVDRTLYFYRQRKHLNTRVKLSNPLAIRVPLHNPDKWLGKLINRIGWLFNTGILMAILGFLAIAVVVAIINIDIITQQLVSVANAPQHWWLYALLYPIMKALHEFAHALAIKRWGGSVHETGISFLVLMPIPYVDASDAWMFPERRQRILVSAAGMLLECTLAAFALFVFLNVQPGLLHELAFAIFVMGSVATVLFNANPLLKFDGYYILQDWLEIPNLASRSLQYCRYLWKRYVFRVESAQTPVRVDGERRWFVIYALSSVAYRCFITVVIALFLASKFFIVGFALALFALHQLLVKPVKRLYTYLRFSNELHEHRRFAVGLSSSLAALAFLVVLVLPFPSSTRIQGVVWVPNQAQIFASHDGVLAEVLVRPGQFVTAGEPLLRLDSPSLEKEILVGRAHLEQMLIQHRAVQHTSKTQAQALLNDISVQKKVLRKLEAQALSLDVAATTDGVFVLETNAEITGRPVDQGELLGFVVNQDVLVVRAVVQQKRQGLVQDGVNAATVRLADQFSKPLTAQLTRQTPAASHELPSRALAYDGTSGIAVASETDEQLKTLESVFHVELALPAHADISGIGGKAYVTLQHEPESFGKRWWRSTRQLLLKRLTV